MTSLQYRAGYCQSCGELSDLIGSICDECRINAMPKVETDPDILLGPWRRASTVTPREVEYLWYPRIARGKVTLVAGDPGLGKSLLTMAIAAAVTQGHGLPDTSGPIAHGSVLLASFEDDPEDGVVPRLMRQGANLDKVILLDQYTDKEGFPRLFSPEDVPGVEGRLESVPDAQVLIVDPIMAFIGDGVDAFRDNAVRGRLQALVTLAKMKRIAVICVMHLNKGELSKALYKVSGSVGFVALARSALIVGQDAETGRRGIAHIKSNVSALADPLEFFIEGNGLFRFGMANKDLTAECMLKPSDSRKVKEVLTQAVDILEHLLLSGPKTATEVRECLMDNHGVSRSTMFRAKDALGIDPYKGAGKDAPWIWKLP